MRKKRLACTLCLVLLCACTPGKETPGTTPPTTPLSPTGEVLQVSPTGAPGTDASWTLTRCRIVDGAETGKLVLAGEGPNDVYTLDVKDLVVTLDGGSSSASELRNGMWIDVGHTGMILETFPAQFEDPKTIGGNTEGLDDRCGLYLRVLEDLWKEDPGLNDGITELGVDLSALAGLTESEKSAVAYAFGMAHGILPIEGTWAELMEQGYFQGEPVEGGTNFFAWEEGILFSITGSAEEGFAAQKWRSGDGAYFFTDCTAQMDETGTWTYQVGDQAIS